MVRRYKLPAGFVAPCAPLLVTAPPTGAEWLHEIKQDGWRIVARKAGEAVNLWSRGAIDYADHMTGIAAAMRQLPDCTIDGEAVVWRRDGSCDFLALRGSAGREAAALIAFDLLFLDGVDIRRLPLEERRARLANLLGGPPAGLRLSEMYDAPGDVLFAHACSLDVEGIVSKRRGSAYRSGRSDTWRKTLCPNYRRR